MHHFGEASFGQLVAGGEYARILRANQQRYAEKWGREWEPYGRRPNPRYERETEQLREAVAEAVPPGATVLVISRGDDGLLQLGGRRALHFPQAEDGGWAGHHPADSSEAIGHLEQLRDGGAEYPGGAADLRAGGSATTTACAIISTRPMRSSPPTSGPGRSTTWRAPA